MRRHCPPIPFERFADDAICHCVSASTVHRKGHYARESFDFLGYSFRPRESKNRWGKPFINFSPGVSPRATKAIRQTIKDWRLRCRIDKTVEDLARMFNPIIRGWINYYGRYYQSALYPSLRYLDRRLAQWTMAKHQRLRRYQRRSDYWLRRIAHRQPGLFAHWRLLYAMAER